MSCYLSILNRQVRNPCTSRSITLKTCRQFLIRERILDGEGDADILIRISKHVLVLGDYSGIRGFLEAFEGDITLIPYGQNAVLKFDRAGNATGCSKDAVPD